MPLEVEPPGRGIGGSAERWLRAKQVFLEALDLPEPERQAFVTRACSGDEGLASEVESLLESDRQAGSFCETPAAALLDLQPSADDGPTRRLASGTRIGAYEVLELLGAGGMGEVYLARDMRLGRQVAIKTVSVTLTDPAARTRLVREAQHASSLRHPNICTIFEIGEADGYPFIVMEHVDGRSLHEVLRTGLPAVHTAVDYGRQIADALAHAHDRGLVHRDLTSSNVAIDRSGRAIVLDFGLARRIVAQPAAESSLTIQHALPGTVAYMAPELLRGDRADARSDVWSLGVLLYEMVAGHLPFTGRTAIETGLSILQKPPPPLPRAAPPSLRATIERCLAKDADHRYQRAAEVREALARASRPARWWAPARLHLPALPRRSWQVAAAAGGLLLAAVSLGSWMRLPPPAGSGEIEWVERQLTMNPVENPLWSVTLSPDGRYVAYSDRAALHLQLIETGEVRAVEPPPGICFT